MTTKKCPYCAEEIQAEAIKCKHCGSWLDGSVTASKLRRISAGTKSFYIASMVIGFFLGNLFTISAIYNLDSDLGPVVLILGIALLIYALVIQLVLLHHIWQAIQGGHSRATPGQAVGYLFIPFYDFYWIFQVYWGWAVDYNRYATRKQISAPRAPEGLALALSILTLCNIVPFLGQVTTLVNLIILPIFFTKAINSANALSNISV